MMEHCHSELVVVMREPSKSIAACQLTCIERTAISFELVAAQHRSYAAVFDAAVAGCPHPKRLITTVSLHALHDEPDAVFVEDVAVLFPEIGVLTRPGAATRQGEVRSMRHTVESLRPDGRTTEITAPGTLEGGDTLVVGKFVFVGKSTRTNEEGFRQLAHAVAPFGYACHHVPISKCLHIKSAATMLSSATVLVNPSWIDVAVFTQAGLSTLAIDPAEPHSANVLVFAVGGVRTIVVAAAHPRTRAVIEGWVASGRKAAEAMEAVRVVSVDVSEIAKAEGALTCCSLLAYKMVE